MSSKIIVEINNEDVPLSCDYLCWLVARIENQVEKYCTSFEEDKAFTVSVKNETLRLGNKFDNVTKEWSRCSYV